MSGREMALLHPPQENEHSIQLGEIRFTRKSHERIR